MSSSNSTSIYTGPWINWSHGFVLGSSITLSSRDGAILTSFIATFVTIVGAQVWKIICFILHQSRASQEPQDGLYHQHQNVFRNSSTPGGAAWSFSLQSWYWWGRARHSTMRSLPWALFSILYIVLFAALSIFSSSEVAKAAGPERLIRGSQCGYWSLDGSDIGRDSFEAKILRDSQSAAAYARDCYGALSVDTLKCNMYATPQIKWAGKQADCPFQERLCYRNHTYQMDTGLIDSHHDLGINTPEGQRLKYRRVTTCSVLTEEDHIEDNNATQLVTWNYGPAGSKNYTFVYSRYALRANLGYGVEVIYAAAGTSSYWVPAASLNRTDADIHLVFIASNSITYEKPVDDPIFSAHIINPVFQRVNITYYDPDYYMGILGCAEQHQVCHGDTCTALSSSNEVFSGMPGLSTTQQAIFQRLAYASVFTEIAKVINGRSATALRAAETVVVTRQTSLPTDQWKIELSSWFSTGLAMLQFVVQEYATPGKMRPGTIVPPPETAADLAMCSSQKTLTLNGTISFSVLGLANHLHRRDTAHPDEFYLGNCDRLGWITESPELGSRRQATAAEDGLRK